MKVYNLDAINCNGLEKQIASWQRQKKQGNLEGVLKKQSLVKTSDWKQVFYWSGGWSLLVKIHLIIPLLSFVIETNRKLPIKTKDANPSTNALILSSTKLPTAKANMEC